jgi:hypothetical protein
VFPVKMRVAASVAVTVLLSAALAGCQFVTPQQTARSYTPSDGVNGNVGDVSIRNVFVLAGEDQSASVIGVLANNAATARAVTLEWTGASGTQTKRLRVPGNGLVAMTTSTRTIDASVRTQSEPVVLDDVQTTPGGLFRVVFTSSSKSDDLRLPVLTGSFSQYATLVPTPTPTPTRTKRVPTPEATDTLLPTPTPTDTLAG